MQQDRYPIGKFKEVENPTKDDVQRWVLEIQKIPQLLKEALSQFSEQELGLTFRPEGWTVRQIVHHIADNDMNTYFRVKRTLTETTPTMPSYDQDRWAELDDYNELVEVSISLITGLYQRLTVLFKNISKDQLMRTMISETYGLMTLEVILQRLIWHDRHHIAQINMIARNKDANPEF